MSISETELRYDVDGVEMRSIFYADDSVAGQRPGVLFYPDARGLDDVTRNGARRLASEGYAALACDPYGDGLYMPNPADAIPYATKLAGEPEGMYANGRAALAALTSRPEVAPDKLSAVGYCFGGNVAVEIARGGMPLAAAVGFHGGSVPPSETSRNISGKVLLLLGANDPMIPLATRNAVEEDMRAADVDFRMHIYGRVYHSFTNPTIAELNMPDAARYDPVAEERSWKEMKALLEEVFA